MTQQNSELYFHEAPAADPFPVRTEKLRPARVFDLSASENECIFGWVAEGDFSKNDFGCSTLGCSHPANRGFCKHKECQGNCPLFCKGRES